MKNIQYMPSYELIVSVFVALLRLAAPSRSMFCSILKRRGARSHVDGGRAGEGGRFTTYDCLPVCFYEVWANIWNFAWHR